MFAVILIYVVVRYLTTLWPEAAKPIAVLGLLLTAVYCLADYQRFALR